MIKPVAEDTKQEPTRSPFAGCLILIAMGVVAFILVFSAGYTLKKQTAALASFTDIEPKPAPVAQITDQQTEFNSLLSRLKHFEHELEHKRPAEIALTPTDLNLAIAHFDELKSFRGQISINSVEDDHLTGLIHLPINSTENLPSSICKLLGIEQRPNNLNGTFTAEPMLTDGKLILNLTSLTPTQGQIPDEFLQGISRILISGDLAEDSPTQDRLSKLTSAELREGTLVLSYTPDSTPPSAQEESDAMATKAKQFVALGAVIFLLTMILVFILISRWRKARAAQS